MLNTRTGRISAVYRSLYCFKSPLTWLAIAGLLVNDHLLIELTPSWLTGRLSDSAGLFFFPFLVVIALGLVLGRVGSSPRTTARIAFIFAGLWFALIKSSLLVNNITENVWGALLGGQVEIVMDPTDLMA